MKINALKIYILLLFSICSISISKAQVYGDDFNSVDVAVLMQIKSQGGTYHDGWNSKKPYRLTSLGITNMKGSLDVSKCSALTALCCNDNDNQLTSLRVNGLSSLTILSCSSNKLTSLDLNGCTSLTQLYCDKNQLTKLEVSGLSNLISLQCFDNQLTDLDVSGLLNLTFVWCSNNPLISLNVSGCYALKNLNCYNNQLTSLDVNGCSALTYLSCSGNQLTSLTASGCSALTDLEYNENIIISLDLSGCVALKGLSFIKTHLKSLNLSGCTGLTQIDCHSNPLTDLNVSGCTSLNNLWCNNNQIANLDVSGCIKLITLLCSTNKLTRLNASGLSALTQLTCENNQLTSLDVSDCSALKTLYCQKNQLTSLDVSGCSALTHFHCFDNELNNLNTNGCSALLELKCYNNQLTYLDVSECITLEDLYCYDNQLNNLNLTGCSALRELYCNDNQLTRLITNDLSSLTVLNCNNNQLIGLNLSNKPYLRLLSCQSNNLSFLSLKNGNKSIHTNMDSRDNPILYCIEVDDPSIAASNFYWYKDTWATYSTDCSSKPFSIEKSWTVSKKPGMPEHPIGVVADGCSAIKINLTQNDKSITIENVEIKITDLYGGEIPVGQIGTSVSQATQIDLHFDKYLPESIFYVAPDMVNYNNLYNNDWNRKVVVRVMINRFSKDGYFLYDTINIIRPPVLLIHGLNSDYKCFSQLQIQLLNSGLYETGQAYCVDYSPTNQAYFEENSHVLPNSIKGIKRDWEEKGYAVSKLDIVGHSMGGVLSRLYLQSNNYDNDIHKLITLNTPHSGSQGANILVLFPVVREHFKLEGNAINDLRVTSFATRTLLNGSSVINKNTVPSHAIITKTSSFSTAVRNNKLGSAIYLAFSLLCPSLTVGTDLIPPLIYNGKSDLVVAVNSQEGGLGSSTLIDNEWHCGSPDNATVKSNIFRLLLLPSTDITFSTQGFSPPTLESGETLTEIVDSLISSVIKRASIVEKNIVFFKLPANDMTIKSGDSITIEVARTANVKNLIFMAMESMDSVYIKDTNAESMSFTYHAPSNFIGTIPMYVFGADTLGNVYIDSISTTISSNATAKSLVITYPDDSKLELSQGLKSAVRVSCLFSDNVKRDITTLPDVQYSIKMGNAVVISKGIIKGVHEGLDTLIVSFAGLSCSLPIIVNQDYTCTVNASVSPNNSGFVTIGKGTYFYSDSVKMAAIPQPGYEFDYWSENGVKLSTNSDYSFEIYESKNLVANFRSVTNNEKISSNRNDLISIYPNPNDGIFTINFDTNYTGEIRISIISVTGVLCDHFEFIKSTDKESYEIKSRLLENGIYFVKILFGEDVVTKKIIIN